MELAAVIGIVITALVFDFTNGFHDAGNAIATSVSTRALTPKAAVAMAAVMNLIGAHLGTAVAQTVGSGLIDTPTGGGGLTVVAAALVGAIAWNLITWWAGLPTSSSQALIGGLIGAALAASTGVQWHGVLTSVVVPMLLAPVLGFAVSYLLLVALLWLCRRAHPHRAGRRFRLLQTVSAAGMGLGHGLQDAQKTMGVIVLALVTAGYQSNFDVPEWVVVSVALAMAAGTYTGGWRIIRTLGRKIVHLDSPRGFAAESAAAGVLYATAFVWDAPVSTTQTITSAVVGVGATRRFSAVRWITARNIGIAWALTLPGSGLTAAGALVLLSALFGT